jgi:tetratricopeptide (TPR) repeat protein
VTVTARTLGAMFRTLAALVILYAGPAQAAERVALVIGMSDYRTVAKLDNTVNDATDISNMLQGIGFEVTTVLDAGFDELRATIDQFAFNAETADLALIYFAGHGVEVLGENFLIPVDVDASSNRDIQRQSVSLSDLLAAVDKARKMRIVILDSCRNNPFGDAFDLTVLAQNQAGDGSTRGGSGLAVPAPGRGTLVAFAARAGQVALDGTGSNSPFARALLDNLPQPGLEISLMFRRVRDEVLSATLSLQEPHTYGSLSGTPFYIAGPETDDSKVYSQDLRVAWSDIRVDQEVKLAALADQGDTRSMIGLAYIRLNPEDRRYDPTKAAEFLTDAASAGSPEAQFELAQLYEVGLGVEQDVEKALALYRAAADQDYADALNDLGFLYFQGGLGIVRDPDTALDYFKRAADLRHPQAMYNYAALIDDGMIAGKGPTDAAYYLYSSLRAGSEQVYDLLQTQPDMFKPETRRALQDQLAQYNFYSGPIDGDFGPGTQRSIRAAYGLGE